MANEYQEKLSGIIKRAAPEGFKNITLETKHFCSGAAVYANGNIFMTLTPKGLAIKLPEKIRNDLIEKNEAGHLQYCPKAPIKKNYVVMQKSMLKDLKTLRPYIEVSIEYVLAL